MCRAEGVSLQRGMNYRLRPNYSVILMSVRKGAPYADRIEENGEVLIYEGHDVPRTKNGPNPKKANQKKQTSSGTPTQNGRFFDAAEGFKNGARIPETVRVYEKIMQGTWVYNGLFRLKDAWTEKQNRRTVFKFRFEFDDAEVGESTDEVAEEHTRIIPPGVKRVVWKRDKGRCVLCGSAINLHFDHIIPYSKGGSSSDPKNIQILCARHNIAKKNNIE